MKSLRNILILATALIIVVNLPATAQTPEQLYQRALVKEEGEGVMEEAISLYVQVVCLYIWMVVFLTLPQQVDGLWTQGGPGVMKKIRLRKKIAPSLNI